MALTIDDLPISTHADWAERQRTIDKTYTSGKSTPPTSLVTNSISSEWEANFDSDFRVPHLAHFSVPSVPSQFFDIAILPDEAWQEALGASDGDEQQKGAIAACIETLRDLQEQKSHIHSEIIRVQKP